MFDSDRPSWSNPRVLTTLVLIFLSGGLVGALTMREYHKQAHLAPVFQASDKNQLSYGRLTRELKLSPKQAEELKSILDDFVRYNQDLQNQIEDYRATGKNRIVAILDPEQKKTFDKLCLETQPR